jgi:hypothetical protein
MNTAERFEFKFIVTAQQRDRWLTHFGDTLRADANAGDGGVYPIVSLYYDSPDRRCYWEAWRGVPSRRKLRVRVYGTACGGIPPTCFVEVKHKLDGLGVKRRVQTTLPRALAIGAGMEDAEAFAPPEARVVREVHRLIHADGFQPVCILRYRRHAFSLVVENLREPLRITFDDEIAGRFRDLDPEPDDRRHDFTLLPSDHIVMEVKGAGAVPYPVAAALAKCGLSPRGFSKYCAALRLAGTPP